MIMDAAIAVAQNNLSRNGYLDIEVDPTLDLVEEIERLKREKNAIILAHYYQDSEIQDIADYIGDSLGLSQQAAQTNADMIVFAGVHFMAETAKMLSPTKKVLLPDLKAGCSLADSCPAPVFRKFKEKYPDHVVVSYINCTAELKTLTDVCCTSTNAVEIIESIPKHKGIIFAPDINLGRYLVKKTGRDMVLWNGSCMVHEIFSHEKITKLMIRHPNAKFIAHPECEAHLLDKADYIGSTSGLLALYTQESDAERIHCCDGIRDTSSDAQSITPQNLYPCSAQQYLRLQRLPAHEAQHHGEALPLHGARTAGDHAAAVGDRRRPREHRPDAGSVRYGRFIGHTPQVARHTTFLVRPVTCDLRHPLRVKFPHCLSPEIPHLGTSCVSSPVWRDKNPGRGWLGSHAKSPTERLPLRRQNRTITSVTDAEYLSLHSSLY